MAFNANLFRVDSGVVLKVVDAFACAPGPCLEHAPVADRAWLALVDEADNALGHAGSVVGLDRGGDVLGIAPASGKHLLLPCRPVAWLGRELRKALEQHGHEFFA